MAYLEAADQILTAQTSSMDVIPILDGAHLVRLPNDRALMVGSPPEAVKVLLLWEWPTPSAVVLAPDPLYAHGVNQASFEFLLYNYLFREKKIAGGEPFYLVCDETQLSRVERLVHEMLRGPDEAAMAAWGTPAAHRRHLLRETRAVAGEVARKPIEEIVRILPLRGGVATLPDGVRVEDRPPDDCLISCAGQGVRVPRRPRGRGTLPFFFAEPERPTEGPRFGLQVVGSGSGFSAGDWSSCFIVWINGLPLVIDGTPYLDEHLERLGIEEEHVTGYLITHNHEDHANAIGQLVNRRRVTVLAAPPVMAGLVGRLSAILGRTEQDVARMIDYVPLAPGLTRMGSPQPWFGAEIRSWYSVHTIPTVGVDICLNGQRIRLPGDTLWGRQLDPFQADGTISPARARFIQGTYHGADIVVADAGGGPIHPDPAEVREFQLHCEHRLLVTHAPLEMGDALQNACSGAIIPLQPASAIEPVDLLALTASPLLRDVPERWLIALLQGGEVLAPEPGAAIDLAGAVAVLRGTLRIQLPNGEELLLHRGDLFHPELLPDPSGGRPGGLSPDLFCAGEWTRLLQIPGPLYREFVHRRGLRRRLRQLYASRSLWTAVTEADLSLETLLALSRAARPRQFPAGGLILRQGDPARHFYAVVSGRVEVFQLSDQGRRQIGTFGPGYSFGEIGLLDATTRNATIRALEETVVLELPARAFEEHLLNIPIAHLNLARNRDQRLAQLQ